MKHGISEFDALLRLERKVRDVLQWTWEDSADDECVTSMQALRVALDDLEAIRRVLGEAVTAAQIIGSAGGKARAAALSPERRSEIGRDAAKARWKPAA